jgi:hypothetical protein
MGTRPLKEGKDAGQQDLACGSQNPFAAKALDDMVKSQVVFARMASTLNLTAAGNDYLKTLGRC